MSDIYDALIDMAGNLKSEGQTSRAEFLYAVADELARKDAAIAAALEALDNLDGWQAWVNQGAGTASGFRELLKVAKQAYAALSAAERGGGE